MPTTYKMTERNVNFIDGTSFDRTNPFFPHNTTEVAGSAAMIYPSAHCLFKQPLPFLLHTQKPEA